MAIDVRPLVQQGLMTLFKSDVNDAFYKGIQGRLGYISAPSTWVLPYALFFFIGDSEADSWTEQIDDLSIQISVWAQSSAEAQALASAALRRFAGQQITVSGLATFGLYRQNAVPTMDESDSGVVLWQSGIELGCSVQVL